MDIAVAPSILPVIADRLLLSLYPALARGHLILSKTGGELTESQLALPLLKQLHQQAKPFIYLRQNLAKPEFPWMFRPTDAHGGPSWYSPATAAPTGLPWLDSVLLDLGFGDTPASRFAQQKAVELCRLVISGLQEMDAGFTVTDVCQCLETPEALYTFSLNITNPTLRRQLTNLIGLFQGLGGHWDSAEYKSLYAPLLNRLAKYPRYPMDPERCRPRMALLDRLRLGHSQTFTVNDGDLSFGMALDDLHCWMAERIRQRKLPMHYVFIHVDPAEQSLPKLVRLVEMAAVAHVGMVMMGEGWCSDDPVLQGCWMRLRSHAGAILDVTDSEHPLRVLD